MKEKFILIHKRPNFVEYYEILGTSKKEVENKYNTRLCGDIDPYDSHADFSIKKEEVIVYKESEAYSVK